MGHRLSDIIGEFAKLVATSAVVKAAIALRAYRDAWRGHETPPSGQDCAMLQTGLKPWPTPRRHWTRLHDCPGSYRQVQVIDATSGASGMTMREFGMFKEFGGAVHGSTHTPASSMS